jgi:hypothetical protein
MFGQVLGGVDCLHACARLFINTQARLSSLNLAAQLPTTFEHYLPSVSRLISRCKSANYLATITH